MSRKTIQVLFAEADREKLEPILDALRAQNIQAVEAGRDKPARGSSILAVFSEAFYADAGAQDQLLNLLGTGAQNILPLQLDEAPIPDRLKNALYSRNIISAAGRNPGQIASRIAAALPKKRSRLPLLLVLAGIALLAAVGYRYWKSLQQPEAPVPEETAAPTPSPEPTEIPVALPMGLTMEDLSAVEVVILVGEQAEFYRKDEIARQGRLPNWEDLCSREYDQDGVHFYSREDGHEYVMTRYEDLSFLDLMPNLQSLYLCRVSSGLLPDLGDHPHMRELLLADCEIPGLDWLSGASFNEITIFNSTGSIRDFSPLSSCSRLHSVQIDLAGTEEADLSGFAPPALEMLRISNGEDLGQGPDLSGLAACTRLKECHLENLPRLTDIRFLSGTSGMQYLFLNDLDRLSDLSPLSGLKKLSTLHVENCRSVRDYSPIGTCQRVQQLRLIQFDDHGIRDVSFLSSLPYLDRLDLGGVNIPDLGFLNKSNNWRTTMALLKITGFVGDYSGLGALKKIGRLELDPDNNPDLDRILPYLENIQIQELVLRRISRIDLSVLPKPSSRLELDRCGITDLSTMPADWDAPNLMLSNCSRLSSLEGLQNQSRIGNNPLGIGNLSICNCPRLTDWSALSGMNLNSLEIIGGFTLPSFADLHTGMLRIDSVAEIADLSFLDEMDASRSCSFTLVGLDEVNNLAPLSRFHGDYLAVPPQLAEQAEDLVKSGNFREYRIEFPQGGWELDDSEIALLSLDELDTLPDAILRRVSRFWLAGDMLVDPDQYDIWEDWSRGGNTPKLFLHDRQSDELIPVTGKGFLSDLSFLSKLTGLRELQLCGQPIENLDGIQVFSSLESLRIQFCPKLKDAAPVFALPNLRFLSLKGCPVSSIQGVQNLYRLQELNIQNTKVSDLSPLEECDFSSAMSECGGFQLCLNETLFKDYSPLAAVPAFSFLELNSADPNLFLPFLEGKEIRELSVCNVFTKQHRLKNPDTVFADFVRAHPELTRLWLPWNQALTDLTPLLELENLETVRISTDMRKAIASLDGQAYSFDLQLEG